MQHELATGSASVGGDDRDLDTELVGPKPCRRIRSMGMEGIQLVAALLLRADLVRAAKRKHESLVEDGLPLDLAADIANDATEPASQQAQLLAMAVELFGVGVTPGHRSRMLADAHIGLPQPNPVPPSQPVLRA